MKLVLLSVFFASASALCPSACSGKGSCGDFDKCTCYDNWMGPACDQRVCPYSPAWDTAAHDYMECGNKGECDRGSGTCKCFDGYSGKGCARLSCVGESDCNGHGTCNPIGGTGWDGTKITKCTCDPGYSGPTCTSRMCKPGDDPMTPFTAATTTQIQVALTSTDAMGGNFLLSYTDWRNEVWTTWPIAIADASAIAVEEALEALPNHAIPDCTVTYTTSGPDTAHTWVVTFLAPHNTGSQSGKLSVSTGGCAVEGCQPYWGGLSGTAAAGAITHPSSADTESYVCSQRGVCNSESGICECLDGYYGEACEKQTIIL